MNASMIKKPSRTVCALFLATAALACVVPSQAQAAQTTLPVAGVSASGFRSVPESDETPATNRRLYVGGLSYSVDDDGLRNLFEPFGTVEFVKVIRDFHSGRSKGFGFVEMSTPQEARAAIEALNGSVHERRTITVSEANPPEAGTGGGRRTGRSGETPRTGTERR
ncbi:RNA recognition motif domain-containing protein [Streptomyces sp. NPDC101733]|uniref:RNA recognition motif domain-containing protein n=1 Tax=unclassified Streptomyces TaxID=2593676 RepID=UPI00381FE184